MILCYISGIKIIVCEKKLIWTRKSVLGCCRFYPLLSSKLKFYDIFKSIGFEVKTKLKLIPYYFILSFFCVFFSSGYLESKTSLNSMLAKRLFLGR